MFPGTAIPPFDALPALWRELVAWGEGVERSIVRFVSCDLYSPVLHPVLYWLQEKTIGIPLMVLTLVVLGFHDRRRGFRAFLACLIGIGIAMLAAEFFWRVFPRDRPPQVFERVLQSPEELAACHRYPDALPLRKDRAISSSFPSRHALTSGVFAAVIFLAWRALGWWALAYGLLVSYGRVYGGKHWPSDVIVGFALGALFGYLAWRVVPRILGLWGHERFVEDPVKGAAPEAG